jgi:hypothetical protein
LVYNPISGQFDIVGTGGGGGGGGPAERYINTFNATTSWGAPAGGFYIVSIPAATHGRGANPNVQVYELVSGDYEQVALSSIRVSASGTVSLIVPEIPDNRFAGLVLIV